MVTEIKIDNDLESVCLPLSTDEYDLLEKQIMRDGCQDALKVWDREGELILLDGHNRLKICKKHGLPYDTSTIDIESIDEAIIWIVDNQRGRRNVATKEQRDYISGKRCDAQININRLRDEKGVFKSNAPRPDNLAMDEQLSKPHSTAESRAKAEGVSHFTIQQNQKFAKGIDAIKEVAPGLADKILKHKPDEPRIYKGDIGALPKLKEEDKEKFIEAVQKIDAAMDSNNNKLVKEVVNEYLRHGEPNTSEKIIAAKRNLKPEHVKFAHDHGIPIEKLKTIPQLETINSNHRSCSNIWDGIYICEKCKAKFELFGAELAPRWCPLCGQIDVVKRM